MKKKHILILWGFDIFLYALNIILICVTGASLFNNIIAWTVAIILAGVIMFYVNLTAVLREENKILHKFIKDLFESKESKEIEEQSQADTQDNEGAEVSNEDN